MGRREGPVDFLWILLAKTVTDQPITAATDESKPIMSQWQGEGPSDIQAK
jgi:hypothetical protein